MAETHESMGGTGVLIEDAKQALLESIEEINAERHEFAGQAGRLKKWDSFFNVMIILLGVAAPSIVTYLTQQPTQDPDLTWKTILVVAVAAAFAMLRGVLRFGEKYGYAVMTSMKLRELEANARMEMEEILNTTQDKFVYGKLSTLNREIQESWTAIIQKHLVSGGRGGEG